MSDTPDTSPEAVERLAARVDGAECKAGCGSMAFCMCAYAADCVDTLRALAAENAALRAELEGLRARLADLTDAVHTILDHGTIRRGRRRRDREFQAPLWTRERLEQALKETTHD